MKKWLSDLAAKLAERVVLWGAGVIGVGGAGAVVTVFRDWLSGPEQVPRWVLVLGGMVLLALFVWEAVRFWRSRLLSVLDARVLVIISAEGHTVNYIRRQSVADQVNVLHSLEKLQRRKLVSNTFNNLDNAGKSRWVITDRGRALVVRRRFAERHPTYPASDPEKDAMAADGQAESARGECGDAQADQRNGTSDPLLRHDRMQRIQRWRSAAEAYHEDSRLPDGVKMLSMTPIPSTSWYRELRRHMTPEERGTFESGLHSGPALVVGHRPSKSEKILDVIARVEQDWGLV